MTTVSIKSNCQGVVKFFNQSRGTGLINSEDGSEFYVNRRIEGDADQFHRGLRVVFSVCNQQGKAPVIMDLRRA
ncbi:MAG: cold shock domain-containing protein [Pseudomonadota bacterium]